MKNYYILYIEFCMCFVVVFVVGWEWSFNTYILSRNSIFSRNSQFFVLHIHTSSTELHIKPSNLYNECYIIVKMGWKSGSNENQEEGDKKKIGFIGWCHRLGTMWDRNEWEKKMRRTKKIVKKKQDGVKYIVRKRASRIYCWMVAFRFSFPVFVWQRQQPSNQ